MGTFKNAVKAKFVDKEKGRARRTVVVAAPDPERDVNNIKGRGPALLK